MERLKPYLKEVEHAKKIEKRKIKQKMLDDLKKQHLMEKKQEIEKLKKRLEVLEKDIQCYK